MGGGGGGGGGADNYITAQNCYQFLATKHKLLTHKIDVQMTIETFLHAPHKCYYRQSLNRSRIGPII